MLSLEDIAKTTRLVSIDIETTGNPMASAAEVLRMPKGMKLPGVVIEIGCLELLRDDDGWRKGATWERRINPDGPVNKASIQVHGIHPSVLKKMPRFPQIVDELMAFLGDSPMLAHSASNEISFMNYEFHRAGLATWEEWPFGDDRFLCTQKLSHAFFPGAPGSLDALCDRLWVDRSNRFQHHGALLDADLTADVFMKFSGGFVTDGVREVDFSSGG
ncbi:MAG: DNA polymerase III subunit epsilon [Alphaproteobacteria bacterium]|nr:DNA polymerase III subunit epsilon [Alphaproteobacteria bacterium]